jgi:hypothetical protein
MIEKKYWNKTCINIKHYQLKQLKQYNKHDPVLYSGHSYMPIDSDSDSNGKNLTRPLSGLGSCDH